MKRMLDKIDELILRKLTENARSSHGEIADTVHLSRNAVRLRIERLERDRFIGGYTLKPGCVVGDADIVRALIFVYRKDRMRGIDIMKHVALIPEIVSCDVMSGEMDLVLHLEAGSASRIHQIWSTVSAHPEVANTVTSFVLARTKHVTSVADLAGNGDRKAG